MSKKFEYVDDNPGSYFGMLIESVEDKKESLKEDKKETLKESRTVDYLELDLAEKSGDEDVYNAYDENELTIVKDGNVWYFEHCPNGLDKKVKKLMKKYYPELTYLYESLKEDSEYKTLAKLSNGLEVISYPYGYAVSDGYTADRFVVRDGKYIFDDGRFRLSDKDKQKILSLIDKGVIEESLKEDKFVPKDKMSKKAQKELNDKKRGTWGSTNPVTKVQPNKKAYDRKRDKKELDENIEGINLTEEQLNNINTTLDRMRDTSVMLKDDINNGYISKKDFSNAIWFFENSAKSLKALLK